MLHIENQCFFFLTYNGTLDQHFDVSSLISSCVTVQADLRERQKAVNSYLPSIHLTSEQTPQLATGTHHPSLLLKPDLSGRDSCAGQRAKQLSKMHYH